MFASQRPVAAQLSPLANGFIESFNGRLRDELVNTSVFLSLADARAKLRV
jgi:putative transposase